MKPKWLCFQFNNTKQERIISALMKSENWNRVRLIGISFKDSPDSRRYAKIALNSTRRSLKIPLSRFVKFHVYRLQYNWLYQLILYSDTDFVACFNGLKGVNGLVVAASRKLKVPVLFFEIAPLPNRVQIDWKGINFDSSIPRNMEFYKHLGEDYLKEDWKKSRPTARQVIKKKKVVNDCVYEGDFKNQGYIFCPLQVPNDSQLTVYGGWVRDIYHFLSCINRLTTDLPDDTYFRIKEHPSSKISLTQNIVNLNNQQILLDNDTDTMELIENSKAVLTINSTVGLESFYFGKPVITLGKAFYSFGNLTSRANNVSELRNLIRNIEKLSFSELDRDLFMRFLHYWYPTVDSILKEQFTLSDINARFSWLESSVQVAR